MPEDKTRILVVDDEPLIRAYVRGVLEDLGQCVVEAGSADEALLLLAIDGIKLVISDIEMPGNDGLYLLAVIRSKFPKMPLVVMSGMTLPRRSEIPAGTEVLCKPFSEERLRFVVEAAA